MQRRILLFIFIGIFPAYQSMGQQTFSVNANPGGIVNPAKGKFHYGNRNEPPRAIEFEERTVSAAHFVANINQYLNIPIEFTFVEIESNTDQLGMRHRLLQQHYKGIPLEGLNYRVHEKGGFVTSANGKAVRNINIDLQSTITEESAFNLALQKLNSKDTVFRHGKKLIVSKNFTNAPESFSIAFQFDIDVSFIEQWRVSIDARTGEVINQVSLVNTCSTEPEQPLPYGTGSGSTNYYGTRTIKVEKYENGASRLVGQTEHGGIIGTYDFRNVNVLSLLWFFEWHEVYDFYSSDNTYTSAYQKPAVSVQWAAEQAYEYYFTKHSRNSFDNAGSAIKCYVHVDQNMNNAFWVRNLLAFGDGSNNNPLVELDIVAHELTHGVTQFEAGLQYYSESGALNESFSDIFGKAVEFDTFGDTATWQLGRHYKVDGLRDMGNPNLKNQPDTYAGDLWYTGYEDNGGVHYNSGVQNFWFYLLCEGGSGTNDQQKDYTVNAIGIEAATKIAYRNLTDYLSNTSDYLDSRIGSMLAAADLYGKNSAIYQEVDKAWDAVGVINEPIITDFQLYDITATTVKLNGSLIPRGDTVSYHFEYGTTPALGSSSSVYKYTGTVEGMVTGLQSQTEYYIRLVATNENGSSFFTIETFNTISLAPLARIKQTVDVTETTAMLYGQVNPNSLATSFYFEYGLTPALGQSTEVFPMPDTTEYLSVSASVVDLQPRQHYYYRLIAINDYASTATESVTFFTAVKPVITSYSPATAPIGAEVTINGHNFNALAEKNLVRFGPTRATVLSSSPTQLKVKVPAGASFGPLSLFDTESGLTAESVKEFVPTFTADFTKGDLSLRVGSTDYIYQTLVQDMDGDNKPDIVARHYLGFSVFQNVATQGGDITDESFIRSTFNGEYTPGILSVIDFDGNGLKDIVGRWQYGLRIYPNQSVPGYVFFGTPIDLPITSTLDNIVFNDYDVDGLIDIAGTHSFSADSSIFMVIRNENPIGTLSSDNFALRYTLELQYHNYFLTISDLNNDGAPDVMASSLDRDFLSILTNKSRPGVFEFNENFVADETRGRFVRYVAHDLNEDGWKDVTSHAPYAFGNLAIFRNQGTSPTIGLANPFVALSGYQETGIQPGDMNGDGNVDLLVATDTREFILLVNQAGPGDPLSSLSFENLETYGTPDANRNTGSGDVSTQMTINDLNGDGRPEIINVHSYGYGPHDGYNMEIWQNATVNCLDPSLISLDVSRYVVTILLPPNTTLEQFEIEYRFAGSEYWSPIYSTTLEGLYSGYTYQLRARAKCYLGFSEYWYKDFALNCVNTDSFSLSNIGVSSVTLYADEFYSFEVEYSQTGKDEWSTVTQGVNQITDLLPGTTYDVRFRGRCNTRGEFKYKQFTTICPQLSTVAITNIKYNSAVVYWTSSYAGSAILEYSVDNVNWNLIDETNTMFPLLAATQYFVRARLACTDINSAFIYTSFKTPCPRLLSLNVESVSPFSALINWTDESDADSYTVKYSMTAGGTITTAETSSTYFTLENLNPGTHYTVSVAPQCIGTKDFSSVTFTTVCYVPFNLSANAVTYTTAELSWEDNFSGVPYSIDYSISGSNVWQTTQTTLTDISLADLRPGTKYEARVHITCLSQTAPHASVFFETNLYEETTFFPNPTVSEITIHPSKDLIGNRISIYNNVGTVVAQGQLLSYTIDLSTFPPGMYTLKIEGEKLLRVIKH